MVAKKRDDEFGPVGEAGAVFGLAVASALQMLIEAAVAVRDITDGAGAAALEERVKGPMAAEMRAFQAALPGMPVAEIRRRYGAYVARAMRAIAAEMEG